MKRQRLLNPEHLVVLLAGPISHNSIHLTDIPRQREEYEVIYCTRRNAECHITSILRAGVEYQFY